MDFSEYDQKMMRAEAETIMRETIAIKRELILIAKTAGIESAISCVIERCDDLIDAAEALLQETNPNPFQEES